MAQVTALEQYGLIAVILVVLGLFFGVARKVWSEVSVFLMAQDEKRSDERERQRVWESDQNEKRENSQNVRDTAWREMVKTIQESQITQSQQTLQMLQEMSNGINGIRSDLMRHDDFVRNSKGELSRENAEKKRVADGS